MDVREVISAIFSCILARRDRTVQSDKSDQAIREFLQSDVDDFQLYILFGLFLKEAKKANPGVIFGHEEVEAIVEWAFLQCEYAQHAEMLAYAFKTTTSDSGGIKKDEEYGILSLNSRRLFLCDITSGEPTKLKKKQIHRKGETRTNAHLLSIKVATYRSDFVGDGIAFLTEGIATMVLRLFWPAYDAVNRCYFGLPKSINGKHGMHILFIDCKQSLQDGLIAVNRHWGDHPKDSKAAAIEHPISFVPLCQVVLWNCSYQRWQEARYQRRQEAWDEANQEEEEEKWFGFQSHIDGFKAAAAEQQNHFTLTSGEVVVMVDRSCLMLYNYALSAKHWKADDFRLEALREEGVNLAFGEKLIEAQRINLDKGSKKFNAQRKRNRDLFNAVECYEEYSTEVSLDELEFN